MVEIIVCMSETCTLHNGDINFIIVTVLTLGGLNLFFKILPISNAGDSIANILATVHFL